MILRGLRVTAIMTALWLVLAVLSTTFAPPEVCCYEVANWNGKTFVYTGVWKCLK